MIKPIPYLSFNGNCKEAMEFYQQCLGGELSIQMVNDYPEGKSLPKNMKDCVVQATLKMESLTIIGTDLTEEELTKGNAVSILLDCRYENDLKRYFHRLSKQSQSTIPISITDHGVYFGGITDKFGVKWLFSSPQL